MIRKIHLIYPLKRLITLIALCYFAVAGLSGCAAVFVAGAGAGAYSYISGNLSKVYNADYKRSVRVSAGVIDQLQFKLNRQTGDALKTVLEGKRADDTPVTITVEWVDNNSTRIGVRTGHVGFTSLETSELIHQKIAGNLTVKKRKKKKEKPSIIATSSKKVKSNQEKISGNPANQPPIPEKQAGNIDPEMSLQNVPERKQTYVALPENSIFIYYQRSEIDIPSRSVQALNGLADYLQREPQLTLEVKGYTDSFGDADTNLSLSRKRAKAVKSYLMSKGVEASRIFAEGYGGTNFLESNKTEKLRALNRRVELHIR